MVAVAEADYKIQETSSSLKVHDPKSGYILELGLHHKDWLGISFELEDENGHYLLVTDRDFEHYSPRIRKGMVLDSSKQYVEVGAGLGGFIQHLLRSCSPRHSPIVIDLADYGLMRNMLEFANRNGLGDRARVETLIERCTTILDPTKVRLVNMRLGEALRKNPDLEGIADFVVDNMGASWYHGVETPSVWSLMMVKQMEKRLLKKDGLYLSSRYSLFPRFIF